MAEMLNFELVSPERRLAATEAEAVTIPGMEGDLTAMANHAPFLTTMRPGFVVVRRGAAEEGYLVTGGFAEISDNTVSVLAEDAVEKGAANRGYIEERIAAAEAALEEAAPEAKQALQQKLNDFKALLDHLGA